MDVGWRERVGGAAIWLVLPTLVLGPWWLVAVAAQTVVIGLLLVVALFTRP